MGFFLFSVEPTFFFVWERISSTVNCRVHRQDSVCRSGPVFFFFFLFFFLLFQSIAETGTRRFGFTTDQIQ